MESTDSTQIERQPGTLHFFVVFLIFISLISAAWTKYRLAGLICMSLCALVLVLIARTSRKWAWILGLILVPIAAIAGAVIHELATGEVQGRRPQQADQFGGIPVSGDEKLSATRAAPQQLVVADPAEEANRAADEANRAAAMAQQAAMQADKRRQAQPRPLSEKSLRKFNDNPGWIGSKRGEDRAPERHETVILHRPQHQDTDLPTWGNNTDPAKTVNSSK